MNIIKKVFTEDSAKVFKACGDVLCLDDESAVGNYSKAKILFKNPVRVLDESGKLIGSANLFVEDNTLTASFSLDYSTPERFNIQTGDIPVYSKIDFNLMEIITDEYGTRIVKTLDINSLILTITQPDDIRIRPIGQ